MRTAVLSLTILMLAGHFAIGQTREEKVLADRKKFENDPNWIYNDVSRGFAEAKRSGKPMLIVLRCLPCAECVKLDDDLLQENPRVRKLLEQFVCVRVVSTNGLDLSLFQFDTDQSFAAFLLNGDGAIYGRYGTRSHRTSWTDDVSIEGLASALEGALALHRDYPANKQLLAARRGPAPLAAAPELLPGLKGKYGPKITYEAKVVQSCIHCHQIGDALKDMQRVKNEPFNESLLFAYPHPKILGLILDPKERATVLQLEPKSIAAVSGFRKGDKIAKLDGQPLLSIADVQWVLHHLPAEGATLAAEIERDGQTQSLTLALPKGWRQRDDLSWRSSTWGLRRMTTGGILLEALSDAERKSAGIEPGRTALRAKHVGEYGPHAAAKNAGFRQGDVIVAFDGKTHLMRETDLIAEALFRRRPGDRVPVVLIRDGKRMELTLPMQP
jgi:serine protease Do